MAILKRHLVEKVPVSDLCDEKMEKLEAKLVQKNEVMAELMEEHVNPSPINPLTQNAPLSISR